MLDLQFLGMARFLVKIVLLFVLFWWEKQQERYCFLRTQTANQKPFLHAKPPWPPVKNPHSHVNAYKHFFPFLFNHFIVLFSCFFFFLHCWAKEGLLQNVPGAVLSALKDRKSLLCWLLVIKFYKGLGSELQNNMSHPLIWKYFQKLWIECCCKILKIKKVFIVYFRANITVHSNLRKQAHKHNIITEHSLPS